MTDEMKEEKTPQAEKAIGFPCHQCGNQMTYAPESGNLFCEYCKTEVPIPGEAHEAAEYVYYPDDDRFDAPNWADKPERLLTCPACGADTMMGSAAMTASCPFCGSHYVTEAPKDEAVICPETMIPFRVGEGEAKKQFAAWVKKQWLAPQQFRKTAHKPKQLTGVYIPFWTFDASLTTAYHGFGGRRRTEHYTVRVNGRTETRTRTKTDWYPVAGHMDLDFDNMPTPATAKVDRTLLNKAGPFSVKVLYPYNPAYLAGFFAERYSIGLSQGFDTVRRQMEVRMVAHIESSLGYDTYRGMHYEHHFHRVRFKHILLPLWIAAYSYREKTFQFLVNGESGRVAGRSPISALKVAALVAAGILAAGLLVFGLMLLGE